MKLQSAMIHWMGLSISRSWVRFPLKMNHIPQITPAINHTTTINEIMRIYVGNTQYWVRRIRSKKNYPLDVHRVVTCLHEWPVDVQYARIKFENPENWWAQLLFNLNFFWLQKWVLHILNKSHGTALKPSNTWSRGASSIISLLTRHEECVQLFGILRSSG